MVEIRLNFCVLMHRCWFESNLNHRVCFPGKRRRFSGKITWFFRKKACFPGKRTWFLGKMTRFPHKRRSFPGNIIHWCSEPHRQEMYPIYHHWIFSFVKENIFWSIIWWKIPSSTEEWTLHHTEDMFHPPNEALIPSTFRRRFRNVYNCGKEDNYSPIGLTKVTYIKVEWQR